MMVLKSIRVFPLFLVLCPSIVISVVVVSHTLDCGVLFHCGARVGCVLGEISPGFAVVFMVSALGLTKD